VVPGPDYFQPIMVVPVNFRANLDLKFIGIATAPDTDSETELAAAAFIL
jgi:hypothetical protein